VRDSGALAGRFGDAVLAIGTVGEFAPIVAVSLLLTGSRPAHTAALLVGFAALAGVAAWRATRPRSPWLARLVTATLGTSVQFAVRLALLIVVGMVWVAGELGLDILVGAFAAGMVFRLFLDNGDPHEAEVVESKLDAIGFGLLVPFFFVVSGTRFELGALFSNGALLMLPAFLVLFAVLRGGPVLILERALPLWPTRSALALLAATGLPLIVVITTIGVERHALAPSVAAALVGAGLLSVLILPMTSMRLSGVGGRGRAGLDELSVAAEEEPAKATQEREADDHHEPEELAAPGEPVAADYRDGRRDPQNDLG